MSLNHFVDAAVDKAAAAAKMKVKSMLGGGGGNAKQPAKSGGMGGLFPSSGDSGNDGKEKKGGLFGGLLSTPQGETNPGGAGGAAGGAENQDFNSAVDELAGF
ncbi:hypothetical protein KOW79_002267 [Hemibagrus wyckioides]|uniref:Uncharacterized protein n=1 Tax=Hemibagrus wyckioides TaxID=337641 RepID=A0A9D3SSV2_9TELE|nr:keratin, type I cytoskeletal 9 [Hemibagrus wyckioides]KAG7333860.1 hypothetical protein KOW79_002267 [Hemibagrus wyckioides]